MIDQPPRLADDSEATIQDTDKPSKSGLEPATSTSIPATKSDAALTAPPPATEAEARGLTDQGSILMGSTEGTSESKTVTLGGYALLKKVGTGAMGVVYRARRPEHNQDVAVKVLYKQLGSDAALVGRFHREARSLARLHHPHIIQGLDSGQDRGYQYVAMEYVDGASVLVWQKKAGRLSVGDVVHIGLACARGLQHAHEQGLIHRDIKPTNILLTRHGVVKIADFGLAKAVHDDPALTASGIGVGTPHYMSPEQSRDAKHVDHRTDVYALGCTLYHLLAGQAPFDASTTDAKPDPKEPRKAPPIRRLNPEVPERLDLILGKMMAPAPAQRYQSCTEVIRDLEALGLAYTQLSFVAKPGVQKTEAHVAPPLAAVKSVMVVKSPDALVEDSRLDSSPSSPGSPSPSDSPTDDREWWYLRYADASAKKVTTRYSYSELLDLIRERTFDAQVEASRSPQSGFRPLGTYREFESELRVRTSRKKTERREARFHKFYEIIEKDAKITTRRKWYRDLTRSFFGWLALVGIAVAACGVLYLLYHFAGPVFHWIASKVGLADSP